MTETAKERRKAKIEAEESEGIYRNELGQRIGKREYETMKNPPMPFARGTSEDGEETPLSTLENVKNAGRLVVNAVPRVIARVRDDSEKLMNRMSNTKTPENEKKVRAKGSYNVPPQITEEDRRKSGEEAARAKREMTSDSDIPASDKEGLKNMLESGEGFKKGGSVRKYAEGGLARSSVRGGGIALRGVGKGRVY